MQHPVDLAVAGPRQPMPSLITGRRLQRRRAVPGREPALVDEPADVRDVAEQVRRAGRADPGQLHQGAAAGVDQLAQLGVGGLDPFVDVLQFGDQVGGQPLARAAHDTPRPHRRQQGPGLGGGQELLRPTGKQFQQQAV